MRNLKKVLALVLSLVMALSLVTVAGAATFEETFTDASSVSKDYVTAVKVVNGLDIFQGQTTTEFAPDGTFNRAQLAGLAYRIDTGDTKGYGKDSSGRYVQSGTFYDVPDDAWYAGYVGYCYGAGLISGRGNGSYDPMTPVTGTDVLAILLHLAGYKDLFKGANWSIEVAAKAQQLGLLDKVVTANDLTGAASRELVCELAFRTLTEAEMVQKNTATEGYLTLHNLIPGANKGVWDDKDDGIDKDITLGEQKFNLVKDSAPVDFDEWGRPAIGWYQAKSITYSGSGFAGQGTKSVTYATAKPSAFVKVACAFTKSYTTGDTECEIYEDLGLTARTNTFELYVNGQNATDTYKIDKLDTRTMVGGQNRLTEVYMKYDGTHNRIVMIDTYLALVTENNEATYDKKDHVRTPANMVLTVFDNPVDKASSVDFSNVTEDYVVYNDPETETWEYEVGDMILINAYSDVALTKAGGEEAAYTVYAVEADEDDAFADVLGTATYVDGTQDSWSRKTTYHEVEGTEYEDGMTLTLDDCGNNTKNDFRWWLDGEVLMGVTSINAASSYGVITKLWFVPSSDGETGTTWANVTYTNGDTAKVSIDEFVVRAATDKGGDDSGKVQRTDTAQVGTATTTATEAGALSLIPVMGGGRDSESAMQLPTDGTDIFVSKNIWNGEEVSGLGSGGPSTTYGTAVADWATLAVSTDAPTNKASDKFGQGKYADKTVLNIIGGHLFKFTQNSAGKTVVYEVGGDGSGTAANNRAFKGMYNVLNVVSTASTPTDLKQGKFSYKTELTTGNTGPNLKLDENTQIIVVKPSTLTVTGTYTGYNEMPTIDKASITEIDWVDKDGDGFADYMMVIGTPASVEKHKLFFYDGGKAKWTGKVYEVKGWLDGEEDATVTIKNETLYNKISGTDGMLWALKIEDNVVTKIFNPLNSNWDATKDLTFFTTAGKTLKDNLSTDTSGSATTNCFNADYDNNPTTSKSIYNSDDELIYLAADSGYTCVKSGTSFVFADDYYTNSKTKLVSRDGTTKLRDIQLSPDDFSLFIISDGTMISWIYAIDEATTPVPGDTDDPELYADTTYVNLEAKGSTGNGGVIVTYLTGTDQPSIPASRDLIDAAIRTRLTKARTAFDGIDITVDSTGLTEGYKFQPYTDNGRGTHVSVDHAWYWTYGGGDNGSVAGYKLNITNLDGTTLKTITPNSANTVKKVNDKYPETLAADKKGTYALVSGGTVSEKEFRLVTENSTADLVTAGAAAIDCGYYKLDGTLDNSTAAEVTSSAGKYTYATSKVSGTAVYKTTNTWYVKKTAVMKIEFTYAETDIGDGKADTITVTAANSTLNPVGGAVVFAKASTQAGDAKSVTLTAFTDNVTVSLAGANANT